jgi:hypothetical protein
MKLWTIEFEPMWAVPCGLVILAKDKESAMRIARETIQHTTYIEEAKEVDMDKEAVVFYESGNY